MFLVLSGMSAVKVGVVGAGIFTTRTHVPTVLKYDKLCQITCLWNRSNNDNVKNLETKINDSQV